MPFSRSWIDDTLRVAGRGSAGVKGFADIVTDSRKVTPGCLFVAIKGDIHDGHDFLTQAVGQGAAGIMCDKGRGSSCEGKAVVYEVMNTLQSYRVLGGAWRRQFTIPVAMVVGSVGKTTTKEFLAAMVEGHWDAVLKTSGSENGYLGIPITLLKLRSHHRAAVIEVGIDDVGAMAQHCPLVDPTVVVCTAVGPEHLEKLKTVEIAAQEELLALRRSHAAGRPVVVNLDDPMIAPLAQELKGGEVVTFSLTTPGTKAKVADVLGAEADGGLVVGLKDGRSFRVTPPLPGVHQVRNLLAAITTAVVMGLTPDEIRKGLSTFVPAPGRTEVRTLKSGQTILCDHYNANPTSMEAAFVLLTDLWQKAGSKGKRWALLGDMLELGVDEEKFHRGLARKLIDLGVEHIRLYGPRMIWLADELKSKARHFATHEAMAADVRSGLQPGDVLLLKGSRGMKMEQVLAAL